MADDLKRLTRRLFAEAGPSVQRTRWQPAVDVYRTSQGWLVKFELAGIRGDEVELSGLNRYLILRGRRCDTELHEELTCYSLEIAYSDFERSVRLPVNVERSRIVSEYRQGMLLVHVIPEEV